MKLDPRVGEVWSSRGVIDLAIKALSNNYSGAPVCIDGQFVVRDHSEIFRVLVGTSPPFGAAIKICLLPRANIPDEAAAKEQFFALKRVYEALSNGDPRYRVPAPLFLTEELASYSMMWIQGESLTSKLLDIGIFNNGVNWFEDAGGWLGNFHSAGPRRYQQINLDERLAVHRDLSASPIRNKLFLESISILAKSASVLKSVEGEVSWLHGDCKADNFFVDKKNIYGIDISLSHENSVEYDLAMFLNNFELLLSGPKCLHLMGMQLKLKNAFLRGYKRMGPSVSYAYLDWLRLSLSVATWHEIVKNHKQGFRSWLLDRMFEKLVRRLAGRVELLSK